jgi:acetylornithine deacetylase/succinyl-diaminopimelate desuccinylase-like protein
VSTHQTPLFAALQKEAREFYGVEAGAIMLYRATTDARFLRQRGIVCYGISPYPVNYFQSSSIHQNDERIRLDWFMDGVTYLRRGVAAWAAGRP